MINEIKYGVVRLRISKGDLFDIQPLAFFETLSEAEIEWKDYLEKCPHGGSWPDWDEYEIHIYKNGKNKGRANPETGSVL